MSEQQGSRGKTFLWAGGVALLIAAAIVSSVLAAGARPSAKQDAAAQICSDALTDARRALYVYRAEDRWPWPRLLEYNSRFGIDLASLDRDPAAREALLDRLAAELATLRSDREEWSRRAAAELERAAEGLYPAPPFPDDRSCLFGRLRPHDRGAYWIVVLPAAEDQVVALIAALADDGTRKLESALLEHSEASFSPDAALQCRGGALIQGSPKFEGDRGGAVVEGDLILAGRPEFSASAAASGETRVIGDVVVPPGGLRSRASVRAVPDVIPAVYRPLADYVFDSRGRVRDASGARIAEPTRAQPWHGAFWTSLHGWHIHDGPPLPAGAYFVEGGLRVLSMGDRQDQPITIIAADSVVLEGSLRLRPHLPGTLVITGGDLLVTGSSRMHLRGLLAVRGQASLGGGPGLVEGAVVVYDSRDLRIEVLRGGADRPDLAVRVAGEIRIRCDEGLRTVIRAPLHSIEVVRRGW